MEDFNKNNIPENEEKNPTPESFYIPTKSAPVYYAPVAPDPELLLKKEYRKVANKASSGILFFYGFGVVFQAVITILAFSFAAQGQAAYNEFVDFLSAPTFNLLLNSFYQCLFMTIPFIIACAISKQRSSDVLCYSRPKQKSVIPLTVLGLGGAMLCNLANAIISMLFSLFGSTPQGGNIEMDYSLGSFFLNILTVAVIPALFEEFAFRGVFMGLLKKRFSVSASIIISAAAFGLIHGNFAQMPFAFLMGLILGYLYAASGSLWVPMLVHFLNNSYSVVLDHISNSLGTASTNVIFYATLCLLLIAGIISFAYITKKRPEILDFEEQGKELSTPKMIKIGFSSPVFIIVTVLYFIDAVVKQIGGV